MVQLSEEETNLLLAITSSEKNQKVLTVVKDRAL